MKARAGYVGAAALLGLAALSGCSSTSDSGAGSTLTNLFNYGGTTVPPIAKNPALEAVDCPSVNVPEGGAALKTLGGKGDDAGSVRTQISIANVARECIERPDGTIAVKVGMEGRALLGPGGGSTHFDVPVTFALRKNDQTLVSRTRRASVTIQPGRYEQNFVLVESDLVVAAGTGEFEIEVSLGTGPRASAAPARRKRARG